MHCFDAGRGEMSRSSPTLMETSAGGQNSLPIVTRNGRVSAIFPARPVPGRSRGATATLEKGGVLTVQYATMVDLLQEAERAGERETAFVNDRLADAFEIWLDQQSLGEITEEEEHALRMAFEKGFGICFHHSA